jgi:hypothetical protein
LGKAMLSAGLQLSRQTPWEELTVWGRQVATHPTRRQCLASGPAVFPLLSDEAAKATPNPFIQFLEHTGRFTEREHAGGWILFY